MVSALSYTATNAFLRAAAVDVDPWLGSLLRQVPVALMAWVAVAAMRSAEVVPAAPRFLGWRFVAALVAGGTMAFVVGNVLFFGALTAGGLGVAASGTQAGLILAGLAGGVLVLAERPGPAAYVGAAVIVVGLGAIGLAQGATADWLPGLLLAVAAGGTYAASNVLVRGVQRSRPTLFVALAVNSLGGLVPLLMIQLARGRGDPLMGADAGVVGIVLVAGVWNALALVGIVQALRHTTVVVLNTVSSATVVFSFAASVLIFGETGSPLMTGGVVLVAAGIVIAQLRRRVTPSPEAAAS